MRSFTDYVEKQTQIIEDKQKELKDLEYHYNNYQPSLFESEEQKQATGFLLAKNQTKKPNYIQAIFSKPKLIQG